MWLQPVCDQQALDNMTRVFAKWQALGVLPPHGQVKGMGMGGEHASMAVQQGCLVAAHICRRR
jgi:hypothetical protein